MPWEKGGVWREGGNVSPREGGSPSEEKKGSLKREKKGTSAASVGRRGGGAGGKEKRKGGKKRRSRSLGKEKSFLKEEENVPKRSGRGRGKIFVRVETPEERELRRKTLSGKKNKRGNTMRPRKGKALR